MKHSFFTAITVAALCLSFAGCKKKIAPPAPVAEPQRLVEVAAAPKSTPPARRAEATPSTPARMPDAGTRARIQDLLDRIQDAYFDYDKHTIRPDAEVALKQNAQTLAEIIKQYPDFRLTVEGHCDERGSEEYNLALGDQRAKQALDYMANLGLPANQLKIVSYGKEKPACTEHDEACWQKNRRAHITQAQ
jgi:peptidoglycan-associated lipoprotein